MQEKAGCRDAASVETQKYAMMETPSQGELRDEVQSVVAFCHHTCVPEKVSLPPRPRRGLRDMVSVTNFSQNLTGPIVRTHICQMTRHVVAEYGGITKQRKVKKSIILKSKHPLKLHSVYLGRRCQTRMSRTITFYAGDSGSPGPSNRIRRHHGRFDGASMDVYVNKARLLSC
jgi:hypothetical protein